MLNIDEIAAAYKWFVAYTVRNSGKNLVYSAGFYDKSFQPIGRAFSIDKETAIKKAFVQAMLSTDQTPSIPPTMVIVTSLANNGQTVFHLTEDDGDFSQEGRYESYQEAAFMHLCGLDEVR